MDENDVKTLQAIYFAQTLGASFFGAVVVFLSLKAYQKGVTPTEEQLQLARILSFAVIAVASVAYFAADIAFKKIISKPIDLPSTPQKLFARLRTALIVRIAIFEGTAFLGLIALMLSGIYGVLSSHPVYWLTSVPFFILLFLIALTFPNKTRLQQQINRS